MKVTKMAKALGLPGLRAEKRVVAAAMRYWEYAINTDRLEVDATKVAQLDEAINRACAALKKARARS